MEPDDDQPPPTRFTRTLERVCGTINKPNLGNRAKLRRGLRTGTITTPEALTVIGRAIGDRDTREVIEMKAGVAALYAAHGKPGRSRRWTGPALLLRNAVASRAISDNRAGRELVGILRETDPASVIRRCHRALTLCSKSARVDPASIDWNRLLADLLTLTGTDPQRRQRTETRWGRDFARIPRTTTPPSPTPANHEPQEVN